MLYFALRNEMPLWAASTIMVLNLKETNEQRAVLSVAYDDFNKSLNSHAFFKVNDRCLGEDLVQSTFIKTWSYLIKGGKIEVMKAFLYHILNNLIIDEYRKHKSGSLDALLENGFELSVDDTQRLFNILDGKKASLLIKKLPKIYKEVMQMKYMRDLSIEEISTITGQTKNAVTVRISRGLEKLKILYK